MHTSENRNSTAETEDLKEDNREGNPLEDEDQPDVRLRFLEFSSNSVLRELSVLVSTLIHNCKVVDFTEVLLVNLHDIIDDVAQPGTHDDEGQPS